jgi:hypothetical protein
MPMPEPTGSRRRVRVGECWRDRNSGQRSVARWADEGHAVLLDAAPETLPVVSPAPIFYRSKTAPEEVPVCPLCDVGIE